MPRSRKRPGHHEYRKPSDIPSKQRTKGRTIFSFLFAVFAVVIVLFAAGTNIIAIVGAAIAGGLIGYFVGWNMEKEARSK